MDEAEGERPDDKTPGIETGPIIQRQSLKSIRTADLNPVVRCTFSLSGRQI